MRVYIAGPYTVGDLADNIRKACLAATQVLNEGHTPFVPHLTFMWHFITPQPYEVWMKWDNEWLSMCDAIIRLPGFSKGADIEVRESHLAGRPVFHSVSEFLAWAESK